MFSSIIIIVAAILIIWSILKEPSTCTYVLKFHTPLLCEHAKFRKVETSFSYIQCNPISVYGDEYGATQMSEMGQEDNDVPPKEEKASSTDHTEL